MTSEWKETYCLVSNFTTIYYLSYFTTFYYFTIWRGCIIKKKHAKKASLWNLHLKSSLTSSGLLTFICRVLAGIFLCLPRLPEARLVVAPDGHTLVQGKIHARRLALGKVTYGTVPKHLMGKKNFNPNYLHHLNP